jgi:hypothetical protein
MKNIIFLVFGFLAITSTALGDDSSRRESYSIENHLGQVSSGPLASRVALEPGYSSAQLWSEVIKKGINKLEDAISILPQEFLEHYVLVYAGHGAQHTSVTNPRTLLFGNDSHIVFAFNGDSKEDGFFDLEMSEFNSKTSQYEYSFIHFQDKQAPVRSEINPAKCIQCHGPNPRTVFNDYPLWPGNYGSKHDEIDFKSQEMKDYRQYLTEAKSNPRYSQLSTKYLWSPFTGSHPDSALRMPNNFYGKLLAHRQGIRLADDMLAQPKVLSKVYSFLAWSLRYDCKWADSQQTFPVTKAINNLDKFAGESIIERYPFSQFSWNWKNAADIPNPLQEHYSLAFFSMGVFTERMELATLVSPDIGPSHGTGYYDGLDNITDHMKHALLLRVSQKDSQLALDLRVEKYIDFAIRSGFKKRYGDGSAELFDSVLPRLFFSSKQGCDYIQQRALAEW